MAKKLGEIFEINVLELFLRKLHGWDVMRVTTPGSQSTLPAGRVTAKTIITGTHHECNEFHPNWVKSSKSLFSSFLSQKNKAGMLDGSPMIRYYDLPPSK